jgi:glycosyltransferase involved in cell wall biosynthesis
MKVCVVIPACNEEATLAPLAEGLVSELAEYDYRILFIDDGSTDGSYAAMLQLREANPRIDVVKFARNCGKTLALAVAFAQIEGDVVVTMDADLQDDPKELPRLLAKLDEGFDLVCGWKADRQDPIHKTLPSKVYNTLINKTFGIAIHDVNTGYKIMRMDVAKSLTLYADLHRLIPIMAAQSGYKVGEIPVKHHPRRFGHSKYGMSRFYEGLRDAARLWRLGRSARMAEAERALEEARGCIEVAHVGATR